MIQEHKNDRKQRSIEEIGSRNRRNELSSLVLESLTKEKISKVCFKILEEY